MLAADLADIRADNVRRCVAQIKLGFRPEQLRFMGFADGCIAEASRFIDGDKGPYGEQNHEVGHETC